MSNARDDRSWFVSATFVLIHSPSVGPLTWAPVAEELRVRGQAVVIPDVRAVAAGPAPYWRSVRDLVDAATVGITTGLVLVAHSNAGVFIPVIVDAADAVRSRVSGCVFVDAAIPAQSGPTPIAPAEFMDFLRARAQNGVLPPWTQWWDESDVAALFRGCVCREAIEAEQPRLPLAYYEECVPVTPAWRQLPSAYLWFGPPYEPVAAEAERRGWPVRHLPGQHLHTVVDPQAVTDEILTLARSWL